MDYGTEVELFRLSKEGLVKKGLLIKAAVALKNKAQLHKEKVNVKAQHGTFQAYRWKGTGQNPQDQQKQGPQEKQGQQGQQSQEKPEGPQSEVKVGQDIQYKGEQLKVTAVGRDGVTARNSQGHSVQIEHVELIKQQGAAEAEQPPLNEDEQKMYEMLEKHKAHLNPEGLKKLEELQGKLKAPDEKGELEGLKNVKHLLNEEGVKRHDELEKKHNPQANAASKDDLKGLEEKLDGKLKEFEKVIKQNKARDPEYKKQWRANQKKKKLAEKTEKEKIFSSLTSKKKAKKKGKAEKPEIKNVKAFAGEKKEQAKAQGKIPKAVPAKEPKEAKVEKPKEFEKPKGDDQIMKDFYPGGKFNLAKYKELNDQELKTKVLEAGIKNINFHEGYVEKKNQGKILSNLKEEDKPKWEALNAEAGRQEGIRRAYWNKAIAFKGANPSQYRQALHIVIGVQEKAKELASQRDGIPGAEIGEKLHIGLVNPNKLGELVKGLENG